MPLPDWQLPPGVDRGLWDYLHSGEMVRGYDAQMAVSPLAAADLRFCEAIFQSPGRLIDLGCGTGRLAIPFARRGFDCVGVDLSEEMLMQARANAAGAPVDWVAANLVDLSAFPPASFDFAACLFSTLGMVRGKDHRQAVIAQVARLLKPGGRFVLHVHNRGFPGLGLRRFRTADLTMPQAYGGAPLTLHHFTRREVRNLLAAQGFRTIRVEPVGLRADGRLATPWLLPAVRAYGYLFAAER